MSIQAMTWAFAQRIPPVPKLVLLSIANCANADGENAFPGQTRVAEDVGISIRSVRNWIIWLEWQGFISRKRRNRSNGSRSSDGYTLHLYDNRQVLPVGPPASLAKAYRQLVVIPTGNRLPHHNRKSNRQLEGYQEYKVVGGTDT